MSKTPESTKSVPASHAGLFSTTSLIFLVLGCLMLAGRSGFLVTPVLTGHGLSWLMIMIYGFGLTGLFGLAYWALPLIYEVPIYSSAFVVLHYGFHLAGTILVLLSVVLPDFHPAGMGSTFVACGAVVFLVNLIGTLRSLPRPDASSTAISTSALWLVVMVLLGVPFAKDAPLALFQGRHWSEAWLVFSFTGVFINALTGLALKVSARALASPEVRSDAPWYALAFTNAGLAWLFGATAFGPMSFIIFCATVYLVGTLIFLTAFWGILQRRTVVSLGWDARILLTAFSLIPVSAGLFILSAWQRLVAPVVVAAPDALADPAVVVGPLPVAFLPVDGAVVLTVFLGVVIPATVALIFQLLRLSQGALGEDESVPVRVRVSGQVLLAAFFNYATGVLLLIPGTWAGIDRIVSLGSLFLLVGVIGFLGNYFFSKANAGFRQESEPATLSAA